MWIGDYPSVCILLKKTPRGKKKIGGKEKLPPPPPSLMIDVSTTRLFIPYHTYYTFMNKSMRDLLPSSFPP